MNLRFRLRRVEATAAPQTASPAESAAAGVPSSSAPRRVRAAPSPAQRPVRRAAQPSPSCQELQQQVDRIDSRMRTGYRNKAGEKLKDQRRSLREKYVAQRCNTTARRVQ